LLIGLAGVALLCAVIPYTDGFLVGSELAGCHFPVGPICLVFLLILPANYLLRRLRARATLTSGDILFILVMLIVTAGLPTFGLCLYLFPILTGPFYMATPENKWADTFFSFIPEWLTPTRDSTAALNFYEGLGPGVAPPWGDWIRPLVIWSILALVLYATMLCLGSLIRRQWTERENLVFPLVQLPLEMVEPERRAISDVPFFRNRLMWLGFALPVVVHSLNSLHYYLPSIPELNLRGYPILSGLRGRPWSFLQARIYLHFSVLGFAYFLTTEISLSLWLFHWLDKLQHVAADCFAVQPVLRQISEYQYQGAFFGLVIYGLWVARGHLHEVWRGTVDDSQEALPYRRALAGIVLGGVVMVTWMSSAGASVLISVLTFVLFLVICWGMARLITESGILFAKATQMIPLKVFTPWVGDARIGARSLTILSLVEYNFMYDLKAFLMPQVMHGLKISDSARLNRRHLLGAMAIAIVVALVVSYYASLRVAYSKGAVAMHPWFFRSGPMSEANMLTKHIRSPLGVEPLKLATLVAGGGFYMLLTWLRQQFLWFPLHPLGYVAAAGYEPSRMWFPFLLGWVIKSVVIRYGSVDLYRRLRAPFLGLVLGEYSIAGVWIVFDWLTGTTGHRIFP